MTTKMWTKPETQRTIKQLRAAGYDVAKIGGLYQIRDDDGEIWTRDGRSLFIAMPGHSGYLVRYHDDLMTPESGDAPVSS